MSENLINTLGLIGGIVLPFFSLPLVLKIVQRRSSKDISMTWAVGVWSCLVIMAPSGFTSEDIVWRIFNILNLFLFSGVLFVTVKYRKGKISEEAE